MKERFRKMMDSKDELESMNRKHQEHRERSEKNANAYTVFLCIVSLAISVLFFIYRDLWFGLGFLGLAVLLGAVAFFSYRSASRTAETETEEDQQSSAEDTKPQNRETEE